MFNTIFYIISLISFGLTFFLYKTMKIYLLRKKYSHLPGPKTNGIIGFYMGNLDLAIKYLNEGKILADLMLELSKTYGTVFRFQIVDKIIVFTIDQEAVKEILISENFPKIPEIYHNVGFPFNERFLGHGLITDTNFDRWKKRRALFNHGFQQHVLINAITDFNLKIDLLLERLRTLADGKTQVILFNEINHAALDIIAKVAFGMNVDSINDPKNELNHYVYEGIKGFYRQTFDPFLMYKPHEWKFISNYKKIIRKLRNIGRKHLLKKLMDLQDNGFVSDDILSNLLKNHYDNKFNLDTMIDDFLTFFVAGQETTANTLAFCVLELARNPRVLKKVREELDNVLGSKSYLEYEDVNKLKYLNCVYKETLRFWPPIPEIARLARQDFKINGYHIPKDSWIQLSTYVSGRYDSYFENPNSFLPERFLFDSEKNQTKH
nr:cytochrome p450 CYP3049F1 [Brachionus angularis]